MTILGAILLILLFTPIEIMMNQLQTLHFGILKKMKYLLLNFKTKIT